MILCTVAFIIREYYSARLQKSIQGEYDAKLALLKAELQRMSDEHQTQFKYWYSEQAAAIKETFEDICDLYSYLKYLQAVETAPTWKQNKDQETARALLKEKLIACMDETARKWLKMRLFLDDKDDVKVGEFHLKTDSLLLSLFDTENVLGMENVKDNSNNIIHELETIMETLRTSFRDTLGIPNKSPKKPNSDMNREIGMPSFSAEAPSSPASSSTADGQMSASW